jgi:hypothetical protein
MNFAKAIWRLLLCALFVIGLTYGFSAHASEEGHEKAVHETHEATEAAEHEEGEAAEEGDEAEAEEEAHETEEEAKH